MDRGRDQIAAPPRRRHPLPGIAPLGAAWLGRERMGRVGEQPPREVLFADGRRPRALSYRGAGVAPARRSDHRRAAAYLGGSGVSVGPGWRRLLRLSLLKRSLERDVDTELAFHLSMREDELRRLGLAPDTARAVAR